MKGACVWCNKIVTLPQGYNSTVNEVVCSKECKQIEMTFRMHFSDDNIGLRNYQDHGINPNHRGRHGKKTKKA